MKVQLKIWVMRWTRQRSAPSDELVLRKMAKNRTNQILAKIFRMLIKPNWVERGPERLAVGSHRMRKMREIRKTVQIIILTVSRKMILFRLRTSQLTNKVYPLRPEHGKNTQVDLVVFLNL
ncbi:hypothetical protein SA5R_19190 [Pantoea dispersa]|uniref:MSP domain-containing protein n=1 Tax=Pantoea dispersa TaxID=59814 RepID=A0A8E1V724_9GAMM|nr:hypothetical protein SA2_21320 [Pantoea dispersa]KTS19955.1 hypothetical protein SA4R_20320 [Pantoea dispersa]KTS56735.1 hypothetical protein SA5R_19190 [Pantoea dispersa]KTS65268.1 hypothetical protein SA3R_21195 [Pantoea dispersa]